MTHTPNRPDATAPKRNHVGLRIGEPLPGSADNGGPGVPVTDGPDHRDMTIPVFTIGQAHLDAIQSALEQAQACLLGETPEDCSDLEAREDTLEKVRQALVNHVPSLRMRLT